MSEPHTLSINIQVVDAALAAAPDILLEELAPAIVEGQLLLEREVRELTPAYQGLLRDSIGAQPLEMSGTVISGSVGTALAYALPVELGARPHMPPVEPLVDWVRRKLGKGGKEGRGVAWAIARKMAKKGTPGRFMFRDGLAATQGQIGELLQAAAARAVRRIGQ
ncbi:hypothetical protein [Aquabacter cavernae]|uniref:hypothetical protein n=1 Tax=Aquabacter cavernae TaxID=2496029 RepID=UPI000F8E12A2|nr:hypothetical protein [Aquabacter cavernae]